MKTITTVDHPRTPPAAGAPTGGDGEPAVGIRALGSVVIPAYNEASVIRRCLDALYDGFSPGELEVVVSCNGCHDDTARIARSSGHPVQVLEIAAASKAAALRAADAQARTFPRLYLDADVVLTGASARAVLERLRDGALAARPPLTYDSGSCTGPVRSYYRARSRVPAVLRSLWGAGVYGLSAEGRARFAAFPDVVADDLWIDRRFEPDEITIVTCAPVVVSVPRRSRDLLHTLIRTYRGKEDPTPTDGAAERGRRTTIAAVGDLVRLAGAGPRCAGDAAVYCAFALTARLARQLAAVTGGGAGAQRWERDDSSRGTG